MIVGGGHTYDRLDEGRHRPTSRTDLRLVTPGSLLARGHCDAVNVIADGWRSRTIVELSHTYELRAIEILIGSRAREHPDGCTGMEYAFGGGAGSRPIVTVDAHIDQAGVEELDNRAIVGLQMQFDVGYQDAVFP